MFLLHLFRLEILCMHRKKLICWSSKLYMFVLLSSAGQQNVTELHFQMFKKNDFAPEKLPPIRESL